MYEPRHQGSAIGFMPRDQGTKIAEALLPREQSYSSNVRRFDLRLSGANMQQTLSIHVVLPLVRRIY